MKYFTTVHDVASPGLLLEEAFALKKDPLSHVSAGKHKVLGLIFFNMSLRTRLSTQKAALNLGMSVMVMNVGTEGWALEYDNGVVMNGNKVEHVKDAAAVMSLYCDIIALRCFPTLQNRGDDYSEKVLLQFMKHSKVPVISMESATLHPLQSLADMMTIHEFKKTEKPKVVLSWAPHIKALPQAVANSFSEWALQFECDLTIVQPEGYELCEDYTRGANIEYDQQKALADADFVYVKNWSSYSSYGQVLPVSSNWMLDQEKMKVTNAAQVMHCLPVRRNVELSDELLDGPQSLIHAQAENRIYATQAVIKRMLKAV
jgi:N-succinyl-L-ornithine transcarbamylase